jgi:hypothetical protein
MTTPPGHSPAALNRLSRLSQIAATSLTVLFLLSAAFVSYFPLFSARPWMIFEEDDFFYYLKIAVNLATGHGSTFNGLVPTNGYHPLWLLLLAAAARVSTSPHFLELFLSTVIFLATAATFLLARRIFAPAVQNSLLTTALAVSLAIYSAHLFTRGMEVILTVPLALALILAYQSPKLWQRSFPAALAFGLLASALILSRLDALIFIALLAIATVAHPTLRHRLSPAQILGIALGLLPVVAYLLINHFEFHTWLPVSGMAKQLTTSHLPAAGPWHSLFSKNALQLLSVAVILAAIAAFPFLYRQLTPEQQAVYLVALVFPFVYLTSLSLLSDWPIWDWYFYCMRIALCCAFAAFLTWRPTRGVLTLTPVVALLAIVALAQTLLNRRTPGGESVPIHAAAVDIRNFALTHPGTYAMGDRSGMVGYLLPNPLVQTEGLVMDRPFLTFIQHQVPLADALAPYHVAYYIASSRAPIAGCFHALEPVQAGPTSPKMSAEICQTPVATFRNDASYTAIYSFPFTSQKP